MEKDYPDKMTPEQARQFRDDVLNIVSQIPLGKVTTYGIIAAWAGWPSHSRMVGRTLRYTPGAELLAIGWSTKKGVRHQDGAVSALCWNRKECISSQTVM